MQLRWPRFSMRFLLIAMLVIGAVFGILGQELVRLRKLASEQQAIITRLESKGAKVELQLGLNRSFVEPLLEAMEGKQFPDIVSVHLTKGTYETADLEEIARLDNLLNVNIGRAECNDRWLAAIAKAPRLVNISVEAEKCTSYGTHALAKSQAPLASVVLQGIPVDDEFLRLIAKQPALEQLVIQGEGITSKGLAELRNAKKLWDLRIYGGKNLGDGFTELAGHPSLKALILRHYEWNTGDLASLEHLRLVTSLCVESKLLPKGILRAAAALPNLTALQLIGDFDEAESTESLTFPSLEIYSGGKNGSVCKGLMRCLATCKTLRQIQAPKGQVTGLELDELSKLLQLDDFSIGSSPSKEAIKKFQQSRPYCVYVDGQWGVFQPRLGINPAKMGRGVWKESISASAPASGS